MSLSRDALASGRVWPMATGAASESVAAWEVQVRALCVRRGDSPGAASKSLSLISVYVAPPRSRIARGLKTPFGDTRTTYPTTQCTRIHLGFHAHFVHALGVLLCIPKNATRTKGTNPDSRFRPVPRSLVPLSATVPQRPLSTRPGNGNRIGFTLHTRRPHLAIVTRTPQPPIRR